MKTTRRHILKALLFSPLAAALGKETELAVAEPDRPVPAPLLLSRFSIAGFQFYDGPALVHGLRPGVRLNLIREPENRHDRFAVAIRVDRAKLGYVPRSDNIPVSRLLDQGATLNCCVTAVNPKAIVQRMVQVEVSLTTPLSLEGRGSG